VFSRPRIPQGRCVSLLRRRAGACFALIFITSCSIKGYADTATDIITYYPNYSGWAMATAQGVGGEVASSVARANGVSGAFTQFTLVSTIQSGVDPIYVQSRAGWASPVPDEGDLCTDECWLSGVSWMFTYPEASDASKWLYGNSNAQLVCGDISGVKALGILGLNSAADGASTSVAEVDFKIDPGQLAADSSLSIAFAETSASFNGTLELAIKKNGSLVYSHTYDAESAQQALLDGVIPLGKIIAEGSGTADYSLTITLNSFVATDSFQTRFILAVPAASPYIWDNASGGELTESANWSNGLSPYGSDVYVHFLDSIKTDRTVTLGYDVTLGQMNFNNSHRYTLAGPGTLHLYSSSVAGISLIS
jgi:hypothetical protein